MTATTPFEEKRRQAAISGLVTDPVSGRPVGGARVCIVVCPAAFSTILEMKALQHGAEWDKMARRVDRTITAADGHFNFIDLPDGTYTLEASMPGGGSRWGVVRKKLKVARTAAGDIQRTAAELALPPTRISGIVTAKSDGAPVPMAEVRLKGGGERAYTGADGRYSLAAIETGPRVIEVVATGFKPTEQSLVVEQPGSAAERNFSLAF